MYMCNYIVLYVHILYVYTVYMYTHIYIYVYIYVCTYYTYMYTHILNASISNKLLNTFNRSRTEAHG